MYSKNDLELLREKGITKTQVETQLEYFKTGFPFLSIVAAVSVGNGLLKIDKGDENFYLTRWEEYLKDKRTITKFVPASGAASRMFKDLYAFRDADYLRPVTTFEKTFFEQIEKFAFFDLLNSCSKKVLGKTVAELHSEGRYRDLVKLLLDSEGLGYGGLPKGILLFHHYPEGDRTALEEHLVEGALYAKNSEGRVYIHFTLSEEHRELFESLVAERQSEYEKKYDVTFLVSYSVQKSSTDTIAVDLNNEPFRDEDGGLLFRPGGHGALIENLNDIDSDLIFIKNIDNVVPDRLKVSESYWQKLLAGVLIVMQQRAHHYLRRLESDSVKVDELDEMLVFTRNELSISANPIFDCDDAKKEYLTKKLDRPFRVCGVVKNVGEPGGGPFIAVNRDGTASPQILESSQIDQNSSRAMDAFRNSLYFNPVNIVCGVKSYQGTKYDLTNFVDKNSGFISLKSKNGRELKALELPGLWNGAMSDWNTVFVELPLSTFNPVKTVNDLLRPEHQ